MTREDVLRAIKSAVRMERKRIASIIRNAFVGRSQDVEMIFSEIASEIEKED